MNLDHDRKPHKFVGHQMKRLDKRFDSLAGTPQDGHSRTITKEAFCSQPEVSTNAFVAAYIDRLLEQQNLELDQERDETITRDSDGDSSDHADDQREEAIRKKSGLTFTNFVHIFWVFSASASRGEKEEVVETLLDPDELGWVDRWSIFRFVKCMLPAVTDRALEGVVDDLMETVQAGSSDKQTVQARNSSSSSAGKSNSSTSSRSHVFIGDLLDRGDFVDRLTLHM